MILDRRANIASVRRRRRRQCLLLGVLMLVVTACAPTVSSRRLMSPEEAKAEVGNVAVGALTMAPRTSFAKPMASRGEAAAVGAKVSLLLPLGLAATGDPRGLILGIAIAPLTTIGGTLYGTFAAQSAAVVERAVLSLEAAASDVDLPKRFRDAAVAHLTLAHGGEVIAVSKETEEEARAADTFVDLWLSDIVLVGEGINPTLKMRVSGGMRVLKGGVEMRFVPLATAWKNGHTLETWAAADGQRFREEISLALDELADDVVYGLLCCAVQK